MSGNKKKVQDKPKTEEERMQEFLSEYNDLCEKHQFRIVVTPAWKVSVDTGTWSTILQTSIGKLPKVDNPRARG